jgi:hypothetical protein
MRGTADCCDGEASGCAWMAGGAVAPVARLVPMTAHRTRRSCLGNSGLLAGSGPKSGFSGHVLRCRSRAVAKIGRRARLIGEKIIGHGMCDLAPRVAGGNSLVLRRSRLVRLASGGGMFALLHQPAREHSRCVLFEPGIEQLRDLLAEIGGVAQAREFVALQGIAGRREKEFPRRLGLVIQGDLQGKPRDITSIVNTVNSVHIRKCCGKVCKSLDRNHKQGTFARAGLGTL